MTAASMLTGLLLNNEWKVVRHLNKSPDATGGTFSESYEVKRDNKLGFLKAFDFSRAFEPEVDTTKRIEELVQDFNHERDVLRHCGDRRLSRVVVAIDHGSVQVPGLSEIEGRVFYMIFEMADGDVRVQMDLDLRFDALWSLRVLQDVCLGLHQVHREMIAHQDAKPSNVLCYGDSEFKIADFGRSSRRGQPARHDDLVVAGDRTYAPPELLYGYVHPDFAPRRMGCDLYMLGNLAAFLFTGANVSSLLISRLNQQHHPAVWAGTYEQVLPYVETAFAGVLDGLEALIDPDVRIDVIALIGELCNPDLSQRGDPRGIRSHNQYSLERYVSRLDLLVRRLKVRQNSERRAA